MSKVHDFGGIPTDTYKKILDFFTPPLTAGRTEAMAVAVLFELVRERHAALLPGDGRTGFIEAFKAFEELDLAIEEFRNAAGKTLAPAATKLGKAIKAIAQLWANGPVANEFFSELPPAP